jgi:hypothetical protein
MQTYRIETIISSDRVLTIRGVPFRAGERVEVIIVSLPCKWERGERYPLRGKPFRYITPFDSVAENDWNVLQ